MSESGTGHSKWLTVLLAPVVVTGAIVVTMNAISPLSVGPAVVLFLFCLLYLWCLSILFAVLYAGSRLIARRAGAVKAVQARRAYYIASVVACLPVLLLGMASIGQIDVVSVGLAILFVALATFYIVRRT